MSGPPLKWTVLGLEALSTEIIRQAEKTKHRVGIAVGQGAREVRNVGIDLVFRPFSRYPQYRNVQDYRRRTRMTPRRTLVDARVDLAKAEALIVAKPHPTRVTPAVRAVAARLGKSGSLRRRGIYVARGPGRRNKRGHETRAGLNKVSFNKPWVQKWSRGKNLRRKQSIRLKGEMLRLLVLNPALKRSEESVLRNIRNAVARSMK